MNGWEEAQIADMAAEDYRPDDDIWCSTDIECPFCGHPIDWKFDHLVCDNCEVTWDDGAAVEKDRRQQERDELSDRDAFDRSLRIGGPRW